MACFTLPKLSTPVSILDPPIKADLICIKPADVPQVIAGFN